MKVLIAACFALIISSDVQAENILCPPSNNQISIIRDKWEMQFYGTLNDIMVSRTFTPGHEVNWSCSDNRDQFKVSTRLHAMTNDKICVIACN
jgi:hypothetical protein